MAEEHKPTRKVYQSDEGYDASYQERSPRQPTVPLDEAHAGGRSYYGSAAAGPRANETVSLKREARAFAWLVMTKGIHAGHIFRLLPDDTLVGRDPHCDVVIDDPSVSRQHAKVRIFENEDKQEVFMIHDMATENGTFVNGEEIVKHELNDGDRVLIGQTELVFKQVRQHADEANEAAH